MIGAVGALGTDRERLPAFGVSPMVTGRKPLISGGSGVRIIVHRQVYGKSYSVCMGRAERRRAKRQDRTGRGGLERELVVDEGPVGSVPTPAVGGVGWLPPSAPPTGSPARSTNREEGATALPPQVAPELVELLGRITSVRARGEMLARDEAVAWLAARDAGASWSQLADAAGMSRQGARDRFSALRAKLSD